MRPARLLLIYWPLIALLMQIDSAVLDIFAAFSYEQHCPRSQSQVIRCFALSGKYFEVLRL